jgi:hypothetical protein
MEESSSIIAIIGSQMEQMQNNRYLEVILRSSGEIARSKVYTRFYVSFLLFVSCAPYVVVKGPKNEKTLLSLHSIEATGKDRGIIVRSELEKKG